MRWIGLLLLMITGSASFSQKTDSVNGKSKRPFVLGEVQTLYSAVLKENRLLNIYLPEGYQTGDTTHYPVVYLLDGSADEDFIHIVGLYQFYTFPWVKKVKPSIVVGIATVDRRRDFTYPTTIASDKLKYPTTGHSAAFISFLEKELQPFIQQHYKVARERTLIGQSLGGLVATEILFTKPGLFEKYMIVSPSLWWDDGSLLKRKPNMLDSSFTHPLNIYIAVGKEGLTSVERPHVMEVDANRLADMIAQSRSKQVRVHFDYLPEEDHATILHQAVSNAIRVMAKTENP